MMVVMKKTAVIQLLSTSYFTPVSTVSECIPLEGLNALPSLTYFKRLVDLALQGASLTFISKCSCVCKSSLFRLLEGGVMFNIENG